MEKAKGKRMENEWKTHLNQAGAPGTSYCPTTTVKRRQPQSSPVKGGGAEQPNPKFKPVHSPLDSQSGLMYGSATMFDNIRTEITTAGDKLAHLRRFL
jgi:hypothetical protein